MAAIESKVYKNPDVSKKLKKMYNKPKYSDTVFLVNQAKFHASSHLVSVSCKELETMLDEHFENCGDREVRIGPIKHKDSFSVILKDIYGLEINFTELSTEVLCEVVDLAEKYELENLFHEVKMFLSSLDQFDIETVVSLVNTAKKYKMMDLYEKLQAFCFEHADQLVKYWKFSELQYDVLRDLVRSDWFHTDEINILTCVLNWHSSNIENSDISVDLDTVNEMEENVYKLDKDSEEVEIVNAMKEDINKQDKDSEEVDMTLEAGASSSDSIKNEGVVKTFSKKIMISLLSNIRFELISSVKMLRFSKTELFTKYKEFLLNLELLEYGSNRIEPRKKFEKVKSVCKQEFCAVTKQFIVEWKDFDIINESNEEHQFGGMNWKICVMFSYHNVDKCNEELSDNMRRLDVYLKCTSVEACSWECKVECQIKVISKDSKTAPPQYLPGNDIFSTVGLTSEKTQAKVGSLYFPVSWYHEYTNGRNFTLDVIFKKIQRK